MVWWNDFFRKRPMQHGPCTGPCLEILRNFGNNKSKLHKKTSKDVSSWFVQPGWRKEWLITQKLLKREKMSHVIHQSLMSLKRENFRHGKINKRIQREVDSSARNSVSLKFRIVFFLSECPRLTFVQYLFEMDQSVYCHGYIMLTNILR